MSNRRSIEAAIEAFTDVQESLKKWGATDTEPNAVFNSLMRKALEGKPWVDLDYTRWQLFQSVAGWRTASIRLTASAKKVYTQLQKAGLLEAKTVAEWYGW